MASPIMNLLLLVFCCFSAIWDGSLGDVAGYGYRLASFGQGPTGGSWVGTLELIQKSSTYGADIPYLKLFVKHETNDRLRVHITDAAKQRWEVPYNLLPREQVPDLKSSLGAAAKVDTLSSGFEFSDAESELVFSFTTNPFGFAVKRKSGDVLFNTSGSSLVFKDQYLEISTSLPETASLYGLGENTQPHGIKIVPNEAYTLFTTDIAAINLNVDLYGSHPFYMDMRKGGISHGVLLLNSNGMDIFYKGNSLTYKVIGGVFDFYFFPGSSPLDVVEQYTSLIGRPAAMPYWAFGFHQCRWGYQNLSVVENVVYNYNKSQIPLDVIWNDDDHMDVAKDFTLDPINYPKEKLQAFLQQIHARGMKYVVLIDPGIAVNESYGTYTRGMQQDIFIKHEGEPFLGQVWPGAVYFPDFLHPQASSWWKDEIRRFRELAPVDGLWIDMNEVSNFCSGKCTIPKNTKCPGPGVVWECCLDCHNLTNTRWDIPPYAINITGKRLPVGFKTIATSAVHHDGILEYDAHSLYGFSQSIATHKALGELIGKRPFVLTRSTFVGSGKYAAHWTGDNQANWENLRYSISTILNFGMFGMPMVGSDICGFYPYTNEELCGRWIQLGAFYPFSRDHANYASTRQELYQWESVAISARKALGLRYRILPYLYTLNYEAHTTGAPIARPLFFTFPTDEKTYAISSQFLLGSSVLVSPVLYNKTTSVNAYFPEGSWYNLNDMTKMVESKGEEVMLDAPMDTINVHLYEGTVLPMQGGGLTTGQARSTPFTLVVAFPSGNKGGKASGKLFLDNGDDMEMGLSAGSSTYVEFNAETDGKKVRVMSKVQHGEYALSQKWMVETVMMLGISSSTSSVASIVVDGETVLGDAGYTVEAARGGRIMELKGLSIPVGKSFDLSLSV